MPENICAYLLETGQKVPQTAGEMARCAFESLALKYRSAVEDLERLTGRAFPVVRIVGGGCLNRLLCQMTADAMNRTVVAGPVEASALGNAIIQAIATGHLRDIAAGRAAVSASVKREVYRPRQNSAWGDAFARFQRLERI